MDTGAPGSSVGMDAGAPGSSVGMDAGAPGLSVALRHPPLVTHFTSP